MNRPANPLQAVRKLLSARRVAVLATQGHGQPYASLVAFAAGDNLRQLVFATARTTRKHANISADPRVAMMIDDRSNKAGDLQVATAVTAIGVARKVKRKQGSWALALLLDRHPDLKEFTASKDCALLTVVVDTYKVVTRFQEVHEYRMRKAPPPGRSRST